MSRHPEPSPASDVADVPRCAATVALLEPRVDPSACGAIDRTGECTDACNRPSSECEAGLVITGASATLAAVTVWTLFVRAMTSARITTPASTRMCRRYLRILRLLDVAEEPGGSSWLRNAGNRLWAHSSRGPPLER